jgi:senataxin
LYTFSTHSRPPGTGKTSTICGLVEAVLSKRPRPATAVHAGRNDVSTDKESTKKILLCAPSNAAIDEVAARIKNSSRSINVVRVGADQAINIDVKDISLDYLIEQRMNSDRSTSGDLGSQITALREAIESVKRSKHEKATELSRTQDNAVRALALHDEIQKLNSKRMDLTQEFDKLKDKQKSDSRSFDATRRKFRDNILWEADVICSTLSGAGQELLEKFQYEIIIIDEASQAVELSSLIPLRYNCRRCVMVGGALYIINLASVGVTFIWVDPQQLPPTVLSREVGPDTPEHYVTTLIYDFRHLIINTTSRSSFACKSASLTPCTS